jgi:fructose-1,6-bisphosphatase I
MKLQRKKEINWIACNNLIIDRRWVFLTCLLLRCLFSLGQNAIDAFHVERHHIHYRRRYHLDRVSSMASSLTAISFRQYIDDENRKGTIDSDLHDVMVSIARSCAEISCRLTTHALDNTVGSISTVNVQGEKQKEMDLIANDIFIRNLRPFVAAMASEEEDNVIFGHKNLGLYGNDVGVDGNNSYCDDSNNNADRSSGRNEEDTRFYEIAFDPLDGSSNLDVNLPTGSIFGIAPYTCDYNEQAIPFSKPGSSLVAAGYALYSSSTELVISFGNDVVGFTLDPNRLQQSPSSKTLTTASVITDEEEDYDENCDLVVLAEDAFLLSRERIICPTHGPYYSLNEARENDWSDPLKQWTKHAKLGQTTTGTRYSSRYVCSLCADFHRTLLLGGWAGNPRKHLRLLYEAAPLAFLVNAAGGKGSDGTMDLLDIPPVGLHDRVCVFLGSKCDINDLLSYGDVRQVVSKTYTA